MILLEEIPKHQVYNLFPTAVFTQIHDNFDELDSLRDFEYNDHHEIDKHYNTIDHFVLDKFPNAKKVIKEYFNFFKNQYLNLNTTDFEITSSWGTKIAPLGRSNLHSHKNSWFSGVVYFDNQYKGGNLELYNSSNSSWLIEPSLWNNMNSNCFTIHPQKNLVVYFPSHIQHLVTPNLSNDFRFSLAFNIIPIGKFGMNDSKVNISYNA